MRHVADRRREHPLLGEILSRRDAVHSLRYRSCFPLSVGGGLSGDAEGEREFDFRRDGVVPRSFVRRLCLRPEETRVRLEELRPSIVKTLKHSERQQDASSCSLPAVQPVNASTNQTMAAIKFGTSGWRGLIARAFTFDNVRLATQGIADFLNSAIRNPQSGIFNRK